MGTSSGPGHTQQNQQQMPPPRQQHSRPLALPITTPIPTLDAVGISAELRNPNGPMDNIRESPSESASSRETCPMEQQARVDAMIEHSGQKKDIEKGKEENCAIMDQTVVHRVANSDRILLRDVAGERLDVMAERMRGQPDEFLEDLKGELRVILEGTGGIQQREEFIMLQSLVLGRSDLTQEALTRAHRVQLEILVAIKTGIQAFLLPDISVTQSVLIEIFAYKRCRNIACQNPLPADDCNCQICSTKSGFCNLCMCVICNKFDFDVNTCRWVGCDSCSHWTHTDCAIHGGQISMGPSLKNRGQTSEMLFRCKACRRPSELFGWVKDAFQHCSRDWDREALMKEVDCVRRIFHGSEDLRGRRLFQKSAELWEHLKNGADVATVCINMQRFFQDLELEDARSMDPEERRIAAPQEACSRIAEVVREAISKMEVVAEEKARVFKKAKLALEMCDKELADKTRELAELQYERQHKREQIEELESIIRLKEAEADMFQIKADEARREADRLQCIVLSKSEKSEEEYASRYLKLRLNEAEAERRFLFEKIQLQEHSRQKPDPSQMFALCNIQDLVKTAFNGSYPESQGQIGDSGSVPSNKERV